MKRRIWLTTACLLGGLMMMAVAGGLRIWAQAAEAMPTSANVLDVVISEVAWMGTAASYTDEWIELYNNTNQDIDFTGWSIVAADGSPNISLSGIISAHEHFLLERSNDSTVNNIPADLTYTGAMGNNPGAESLILYDDTSQIIDTANADGGAWPAGDNSTKHTMERIDSTIPDTDANWCTNDGVTRNGLDADGNPINGTPKAQNSCSQPPVVGDADLAVAKTGPVTATPGSVITYRIALSNTGSATATAVHVTDTLPAGVSFVAQVSPFAFDHSERDLVWQIGDVPTSTTHLITVTAQVTSTASGILTNLVTATTTASETTTANNTDDWTTAVAAAGEQHVLIRAVLYNGYQFGDPDEAVQLVNVGTASVDLTGWELCKDTTSGLDCQALPSTILAPTAHTWLARDAASFAASFGFTPDHEMDSWLFQGLSNGGDEVVLRDAAQHTVDTLVYEEGNSNVIGWSGPAVEPYSVGRQDGQILYRIPDEVTGLPVTDTNTAADWIQYSGDVTYGRRVLYPGWDLDPLFWPLTATETATIVVGVAPDNGFDVISQTIVQAQRAISIEIYSLRHPDIVTALVQKAQDGVSVMALLEGSQVGVSSSDPKWQQELWACQEIEAAGGQCWFMIHETDDRIFNRYNYVHTKLLIVDDEWLVVGSQNFTENGLPSDDKSNGTLGSRGVVVATNAPSIVARAAKVFACDLDPDHHNDILRWNTAYTDEYGLPDAAYTPVLTLPDYTTSTVYFPAPKTLNGTFDFELFTAPEAALRQSDALLGLVARAGAGDTVYVEQMYEYADWGDNPAEDPNLRLEAYIAAARRGAKVRILLNGGSLGADFIDISDNEETAAYVNQIARAEGLNLRAAIGDPTLYGIHNKMVLIWLHDEGGYAHIGSINGSEASSKINREIALQVGSTEIYHYMARVFETDWWLTHPVFLPLVARDYAPPAPPVDYVVISEVYYAVASANQEWVEIYNPTERTIDLSGYKIGDAETADDFEGMYQFPPGTTIGPQGVLVIAFDGSQVPQANFEIFDNSDTPDMIKYTPWGQGGDWTLRNDGDQVLLLGPADQAVDVVVWGDAIYVGVNPHPGVSVFTHSLERYPPYYDTDDCAADFRDLPVPTPGSVSLP